MIVATERQPHSTAVRTHLQQIAFAQRPSSHLVDEVNAVVPDEDFGSSSCDAFKHAVALPGKRTTERAANLHAHMMPARTRARYASSAPPPGSRFSEPAVTALR